MCICCCVLLVEFTDCTVQIFYVLIDFLSTFSLYYWYKWLKLPTVIVDLAISCFIYVKIRIQFWIAILSWLIETFVIRKYLSLTMLSALKFTFWYNTAILTFSYFWSISDIYLYIYIEREIYWKIFYISQIHIKYTTP